MKKKINVNIPAIILAFVGIVLVGVGVAFNAAAALGNDPVGIMYDGIRSILGLTSEELGLASNLVNIALMVLVFFTGRHYINIGTFVYIIPYGFIVSLGGKLYHLIFQVQTFPIQVLGAVIGCLLLYTGVAMYITADIGLDPFTGVVMVLRDRLKKEYRYVKIGFDISCILIGTLLGGKLGVITIITALSAGPVIQFLSDQMNKVREKLRGIYGRT